MDYKLLLGVMAVVIGVIGYIPYFRNIFKGKTKPHAFSWLMGDTNCNCVCRASSFKRRYGTWVTGFTALACIVIFLVALQTGTKEFPWVDWLSLGGAGLGLLMWAITRNPLSAIILVTIVDMLGFIPTFRKSYSQPNQETLATYLFSAIKYIFGIAALSAFSLVNVLYPISLVITNGIFIFMVLVRRRDMYSKLHLKRQVLKK